MRRVRLGLLAVGLAVVTTGCESGPDGPGNLTATVTGPASLGAVTLEVIGEGIRGFQGLGDTRAYGALVSQQSERHRVVLIHPSGGELRFEIQVDDRRAPVPSITVVAAAGTDNRPRTGGDVSVQIER